MKKVAPILLNTKVKIVILVFYAILTAVSIYGCTQIKTHYDANMSLNENYQMYDFYKFEKEYFKQTY